jgi:hypothetical protein
MSSVNDLKAMFEKKAAESKNKAPIKKATTSVT